MECKLVGFADDTNVIRSDKNPNNLIRTMKKDLTNIQSYMTENTLMLNKLKSYYTIFKPKGGKTILITEKMYIINTEIERVKVTRFLGIWIDEDLKFNKQFEVLQKKVEDTLRALAATRSIMNYRAKLLIYH